MRRICEVRKLTGGRYLVSFDTGERFPLYGRELEQFSIREDAVLPDSDFDRIMQELLPKRGRLCAMHFLERTDRTEQQLRRKLGALFYPEEIIDNAVDYMKQYHYVDDVRYAVRYIEYRMEHESLRRLEQQLYQKGISKEDFLAAAGQVESPDEERQIRQWLKKKHYPGEGADRKETDRMYRFLLRKGYSPSSVSRVMHMPEQYE